MKLTKHCFLLIHPWTWWSFSRGPGPLLISHHLEPKSYHLASRLLRRGCNLVKGLLPEDPSALSAWTVASMQEPALRPLLRGCPLQAGRFLLRLPLPLPSVLTCAKHWSFQVLSWSSSRVCPTHTPCTKVETTQWLPGTQQVQQVHQNSVFLSPQPWRHRRSTGNWECNESKE